MALTPNVESEKPVVECSTVSLVERVASAHNVGHPSSVRTSRTHGGQEGEPGIPFPSDVFFSTRVRSPGYGTTSPRRKKTAGRAAPLRPRLREEEMTAGLRLTSGLDGREALGAATGKRGGFCALDPLFDVF
jgi:hypothetical protein